MHASIPSLALILSLSLALPAAVSAHSDPLHPAHHHGRRSLLEQRSYELEVNEMKRAAASDGGLLGGLLGGSDPSTTSTLSTSSTTSSTSDSSATTHSSSSSSSSTGTSSSLSSSLGSSGIGSVIGSLTGNATGSASSISGSSSSTSNSTSPTSSAISTPTSSPSLAPATSVVTDAAGQTSIITEVYTQAVSASTTVSNSSSASDGSDPTSTSSGISTPAIIGIAVGVGVVLLGLIGCAVLRMKRRSGEQDEAIRWPELNRHGDSDAQHALPARRTGQHGFETNPLERSLSIASSFHSPSTPAPHSATPMALNGSSFGAAASLEDEYDEKQYQPGAPEYDYDDSIHHQSVGSPNGHRRSIVGTGYDETSGNGGYQGHRVGGDFDYEDDYSSFPPMVQVQQTISNGGAGIGTGYPTSYRLE